MLPKSTHLLSKGLALLLGLVFSIACDATIDDPDSVMEEIPEPREYCEGLERTPGRVTLHRLNADEYDRTIRALLMLGQDVQPSASLPSDNESAAGFINDADVLVIGALTVEKYAEAATVLSKLALGDEGFRSRYLACDPGPACVETFVDDFGRHAWRRPLTDEEKNRLEEVARLGSEDGIFDDGIALTMRAIMLSPNMLFRAETHEGGRRLLDGYEVASRLSYFLWGTAPDDELYELAESDLLRDEDVLRGEINRMIDDERFSGFFDGWLHRWLSTHALSEHVVDSEAFPEWDIELQTAMQEETELFVAEVVREGLPLTTLLSADFTYLNERLAVHYGIGGIIGEEMRRVDLSGTARGGLLTQGAFLATTSHPNVTSPVLRGKFVLERLLCAPPPAAPADVMPDATPAEGQSRREALAAHRANPVCAACHNLMDPIGLALENFDPIGAWRETEDGTPTGFSVDPTGVLPDGTPLDGPASLGAALVADERFVGCVTGKMLAYAIGRSLQRDDQCHVIDIVDAAEARGGSLRSVIEEMILSDVFRSVGGRPETEVSP